MRKSTLHLVALSLLLPLLFFGCGSGSDGAPGTSAPTTGAISGTVTDAVKGDTLSGVTVTTTSTPGGTPMATATTDALGQYSLTAPIGGCYVYFSKTYYTQPGGIYVGVGGGLTTTVTATMSEAATGKPSVSFAAVAGDDFGYGATVALAASGNDPNGDTLTYSWSNGTSGTPTLGTVTGSGTSGSLTFPTMAQALASRTSSTDNANISGYTMENRFGILPIFPDTRGAIAAKVTVNDGRGQTVTATLTLNAASILTGVRNVAVGTRVYMNRGNDNASQTWTIASMPAGSAAALDNDAARNPSFVADLAGVYTLTAGGNTINVTTGNWQGIITAGSGDDFTTDPSCSQVCHKAGGTAPDMFTPWKNTGHAKIFTLGVNGGSGTSGAGCLACHTVGYDPGTSNNGFDDAMTAAGWTFPTTRVSTNWGNMFPTYESVAKLANIQCENCHGPQTSGAHASSSPNPFLSDRIAFSAEVCASCHGRTTHNLYSQWATPNATTGFSHANRSRAVASGTSTSCGRCHGAQGFAKFVDKLKTGVFTLAASDLTGLTAANVEPVTCTACHDPHDKTNPHQLRVYNNTALLPAGFQVTGFGKGALCVTCHNTRNGAQTGSSTATYLHETGEAYNGGNPTGYSAPHTASQGDVFAGRNAYFLPGRLPMVSKHAAVEDTCVGCHMALNPKTLISHGASAPKTHLFRIEEADMATVCANCHSASVNGEGIQASIEALLEALEAKMGTAAKTKINATGTIRVRAYDAATDLYSSTSSSNSNVVIDVTANPVTAVGVEEGHGQIEFHLTLTNPITITWTDGSTTTTNEFGVQMQSLKDNQATPVVLYALSGNMVRAGWNYFLIEGDDSHGIHNPSFAQAVLSATLAQDLSN